MVPIIFKVYQVRNGKWCDSTYGFVYNTLQKAKGACDLDEACTMLYDKESRGTQFVLCDFDAKIKTSSEFKSTLYVKSKDVIKLKKYNSRNSYFNIYFKYYH